MRSNQLQPTPGDAAYVCKAVESGPIFTRIHETGSGNTVTQELDWVKTSAYHPDWIPSVWLESRLLAGLEDALSLGLVKIRLMTLAGDSACYVACWQSRVPGQ